MEKLTISIKEAAEMMGVSLSTMYNYTKESGFPIIKSGRNSRIPTEAFKKWVLQRAGVEE